jgi:RNA polymerase sigma-70 factor, ECF subfamily
VGEPQSTMSSDGDHARPAKRTLIDDLRDGDEGAYAVLFHEHFHELRAYAFSYVGSWDDAAEVVQHVFVKLFLDRARLNLDERIAIYLYSAVRNRALNFRRAGRVRARWLEQLARARPNGVGMSENDGASAVLRGEIADRVRQLIDALPPKCKDAFLLVRVHGKSYDEAAAVLGVLKSTIQTHLIRATKILGRQLGELGLIDGAVRPGGGKRDSGVRNDR